MHKILIHFFGQQSALANAFSGCHEHGNHWVTYWPELRKYCASIGIELLIDDRTSNAAVDLLWIIDLPHQKKDLEKLLRRITFSKVVFQQIESPLAHPARLNPANSSWASALISYDKKFLKEACNLQSRPSLLLPLSLSLVRPSSWEKNWDSRHHIVMMNTNHSYGFWSRRSGHGLIRSMPVAKWYASGYKISNQHVFELLTREMYGARRRIARAFDSFYESKRNPCYACHIYGTNWRGESTSWLHKLLPPKPFLFSQGRAVGNKLEYLSRYRFTIAFENYSGDRGYVSEKIIDPILAGSVPIYHGDAHISRYIPSNCFVDARAFKSASSLMHYIASMNKAEWACLHEAGTKFLLSEASLLFSSQKAAEKTGQFFYSLIVSS